MRIAFITLFKEGFGGGEGRIAYDMAYQFASCHNVILICPADQTYLHQSTDHLKILGIKSVGDGHINVPILSQKNVNVLFDCLDDLQPDILHAHEPMAIALIGQVWAKMHKVPFVHTTHVLPTRMFEFGAADVIKVFRSPLTGSVAKRYLLTFYENCDAVIALNRAVAQDLFQFGYRGKILMVPNGRDLEQYANCKSAVLSAQDKLLTFTGFISRRKNQQYLIEVLAHLGSGYKLQLVGESIDPSYQKELEQLIEKYHLDNVAFTGPVDHREIASYLERAHVFVSASKMEVQSLSIIEALASGTPVVGLSNETVDELVDEGVGCRLPGYSGPEAFARCVAQICHLPQAEYDRLCEAARERVKHLDWPNVIDQTVQAYRSLLRERPVVTTAGGPSVVNIIRLIPSAELREILTQRIKLFRTAKSRAQQRSGARPRFGGAKRIPGRTWIYVGMTMVVSFVGYLLVRPPGLVSRIRGLKVALTEWAEKAMSAN